MMITSSSVQRVVQNHDGHHNTARHFLTRPQKNFSVLKGSWPAHKSTFTCKSGVKKNSCHYKDLLQILCNLSKKWKNIFWLKNSKLTMFGSLFFQFSIFEAIQIWSKYSKWPLILLAFKSDSNSFICSENVVNDSKKYKMIKIGSKSCKRVLNDSNRSNMIHISSKSFKLVQNYPIGFKIFQKDTKSFKMIQKGSKWIIKIQNRRKIGSNTQKVQKKVWNKVER